MLGPVAEALDDGKPPLALQDVARAALDLSAKRELSGLLSGFLDLVRAWAAPSAVLAAVREPQEKGGWRVLPALSFGSVPLGAERSVARIVEESPECLARPTIVQPADEIPGVKVRDNWVVPWWCEGECGLLVLRGVPCPYPANLGDALVLVSAAVWPRILGGPAARIEALVSELQTLSGRLQDETARQIERLHAARPGDPAQAAEPPADTGRLAELDAQLREARQEAQRALGEQQTLRQRLAEVDAQLREARQDALGAVGEQDSLRERLAQLQRAHDTAAAERDWARGEAEQLASQVGSLESERTATATRSEEGRRAIETAEARVRRAEEALAAAQREVSEARALAEEEKRRADELARRSEGAVAAFRLATAVVRRASFVPPALRVSIEEAASLVEVPGERPAPWLRVALLDRDAVGLENLAAELEAAGIDVRLANHPEEVALLLKTPDARELSAAVCDVMAFRPDQNVAGLFRSWDKDRPGLAFYLTYDAGNPAEADRARRVPTSLTVGHIPRPFPSARLIESLETLARRQHRS
jgi:hypothetical protein